MNSLNVKWKEKYLDPSYDAGYMYCYTYGSLIGVTSGFLGIRKFGLVKTRGELKLILLGKLELTNN